MADTRSFTPENVNKLKSKFEGAGQGHVFTFYDELSPSEKESLFTQLLKIDPDRVNSLRDLALNPPKEDANAVLEPLPESATASILDSKADDIERWYNKGLDLIAENKVAVVLLAGGQGTRLGSKAPKGCYNIGLPSGKSLFELQAERIVKVQELAAKKAGKKASDVVVPWYVMTSGPTRGPTEKYFVGKEPLAELSDEDNKRRLAAGKPYFGLATGQVQIFEQGVLPCIANDGKIMLESKGKVAVAPDGNGGLYKALQDEGVLASMAEKKVEHVYAYCVDNCLSKVADPVFIGFSAERGASISTKVVRKRNASESVGLIVQKNGKPDVVEYSEIDQATAEAEDPRQAGVLKFRAANIVNHYYSFAYLDGMGDDVNKLPPHVARKKIPYLDLATGQKVTDVKSPNGIKLEQFVFDNFKWVSLDKFACFEVVRREEFSPLKNADPKRKADGVTFEATPVDGPHTSKSDILSQGKRWLEAAGATVPVDGVEVSPLKSYVSHTIVPLNIKASYLNECINTNLCFDTYTER